MIINFHPDAIKNFNAKAEELLFVLAPAVENPRRESFQSEQYIDQSIDAKDIIGEMSQGQVDFTGREVSKYFNYSGKLIGLEKNSYQSFFKLCESIQRTKQCFETTSLNLIKEKVFEWMESRYKGGTKVSLIDFIQEKLEKEIKEIEIWVPIHSLLIQSSFFVGKVYFRPITKALFDDWQSKSLVGRPEEEAHRLNEHLENERKKIQGLATGTLKIEADLIRAGQIAKEEIERSLNILRFFEPINFHPLLISHCAIIGKENIQTTKHYVIENNILSGSTESMTDSIYHPWKIDNEFLQGIQSDGLNILHSILLLEQKSDFQSTILDVLQTYSRVGLANNYSDKIVYLLVTLESLLLKNTTEPIQQNVGERMAFALTNKPEDRKQIVKNFKEIYELRSKFVHHGNDVESVHIHTLNEFMINVWDFLHLIINNANKFQTKEQMIDAIENIKYS